MKKYIDKALYGILLMAVIAGTVQAVTTQSRFQKAREGAASAARRAKEAAVSAAKSAKEKAQALYNRNKDAIRKTTAAVGSAAYGATAYAAFKGVGFKNPKLLAAAALASSALASIGFAGLDNMSKEKKEKLKADENLNITMLLEYLRTIDKDAPEEARAVITHIKNVAMHLLARTIVFPENVNLLDFRGYQDVNFSTPRPLQGELPAIQEFPEASN